MRIRLALVLIAAVGCGEGERAGTSLKIVVVGNNVPTSASLRLPPPPSRRAFEKEEAKGRAIWAAARLAFDSLDPQRRWGVQVELLGADDWGDTLYAGRIAARLTTDPAVIAVIGSTASSTSRALGPPLAEFRISLLMPIATSPLATTDPATGERMTTVFRLPPSDARVQAPAIAGVVTNILRSRRVALIRDQDPGAWTYSEPLCAATEQHLNMSVEAYELERRASSAQNLAGTFLAAGHDVLVFCGYFGGAEQLLFALADAYSGRRVRPTIILTDGAMDRRLRAFGFNVFITFPLPPVDSLRARGPTSNALAALIDQGGAQSYEVYAYDAVRMIAAALDNCSDRSRRCLVRAISELQQFVGAMFTYSFIGGENASANYYLYRVPIDTLAPLTLVRTLTLNDVPTP